MESIFHMTSGYEPRYQKDTPSIGCSVGNIRSGSNRACEFLVAMPSDIPQVSLQIPRVFREVALPYFERYSSISAIDERLNAKPAEPNPHRVMSWLRASTGIIAAKLTGRPNYDELVATYKEIMARENKGFYLKRFEAPVDSLKTIPAENISA